MALLGAFGERQGDDVHGFGSDQRPDRPDKLNEDVCGESGDWARVIAILIAPNLAPECKPMKSGAYEYPLRQFLGRLKPAKQPQVGACLLPRST
jgi:hypothetical protein